MHFYIPYLPYKSFFAALIISYLCSNNCSAQAVITEQVIEAKFFKDSLQTSDNSFYYNSLSVTNKTGKTLKLNIQLDLPCFTTLVSAKQQYLTLEPHATNILPIRFAGNAKTSCLLDWQPFVATITEPSIGLHSIKKFLVKPQLSTKWKVGLIQPVIFISPATKSVTFFVRLQNNGNIKSTFKFSIKTDLPLNIGKDKFALTLQPAETKLQEIKIMLSPAELAKLSTNDITIFVENGDGDKRMIVQKFSKVDNSFVENSDRWQRMPLTAEVNALNVGSQNPVYFARVQGKIFQDDKKEVNVTYQSGSYHKNYYLNTGIQTLEYKSQHLEVTAGTIMDYENFIMNGNGARIKYIPAKDKSVELAYVKSRLSNVDQFSFKTKLPLTKSLSHSTSSFANFDNAAKQKSYILQNKLQINVTKKFAVGVEGGIGVEDYSRSDFDSTYYSTTMGFYAEKNEGNLLMSAKYLQNSKFFPGINKGFAQYFHDIRYQFKKFSIGSYVEMNKHTPSVNIDSTMHHYFNYSNTDVSAKINYNSKKINIAILPGLYTQKQDSTTAFTASMAKVTSQLSVSFGKWQGSLINNVGRITIPGNKDAGSIFSMYNILSIQKENFGLFSRFDVGPYFYYDIKNYLLQKKSMMRLQVSPNYNFNIEKLNLSIRNQLSFSYAQPYNEAQTFLSNNVYWQSQKDGIGAGLNTNIEFSKRNNTIVNLFLRKNFNVPVYKKSGYKDLKLVLFKDENKNNIKDADDEPVANARIFLNDVLVETNASGQVQLQNVTSKQIVADFSFAINSKGWIPVSGLKQTIKLDGAKTIFIAFKKGRSVTGRMILDKDAKSDLQMAVENIRIKLVGKEGTTYSTLTAADGSYFLDVPEDEYIISVNQNAIDETYKAIDPVRNVDLVNNETLNVDFILRQKRREINIKKQ
ncbi:MAG TPA: hypothetical protein VF622_13115 [Segetibacter sp.]|jgi:hypothetical protein